MNHVCSATIVRVFDAPETLPYAQKRYIAEAKRLLYVLCAQLTAHQHVAGTEYSIADMVTSPRLTLGPLTGPLNDADLMSPLVLSCHRLQAILPWVDYFLTHHSSRLDGAVYPHVSRWIELLTTRPAVIKVCHVSEWRPS